MRIHKHILYGETEAGMLQNAKKHGIKVQGYTDRNKGHRPGIGI